MEVKFDCFPPNVKIWMADDKIIMRHTLNVNESTWEELRKYFPENCIRGKQRFIYGNAVYLKSLDKKIALDAYYFLKKKNMYLIREAKMRVLNEEADIHKHCAIMASNSLMENPKFLEHGTRL